jgi:AcrR family transcriptional regulator
MVQNTPPAFPRPRGRPRKFVSAEVLDKARDAFWNTGYAATSLDDLSAATGLNRPSLYGAFGDKQALYLATLDQSRKELVASLHAAMAPEEPLRPALERVFGFAAEVYVRGEIAQRGCFIIGTAVTESVADPKIRALLAQTLAEIDAEFEARLVRAQAAGELSPALRPADLAKLATGALNGMAVRARSGGDVSHLAGFGRGLIDMICGPG